MPVLSERTFRTRCKKNDAFRCPECGHRNVGRAMKCEACPFDAWKRPELCQTFVLRRGVVGLIPVMEFDDTVVVEIAAPRKRAKASARKPKGFRGEPEPPRRRKRR